MLHTEETSVSLQIKRTIYVHKDLRLLFKKKLYTGLAEFKNTFFKFYIQQIISIFCFYVFI